MERSYLDQAVERSAGYFLRTQNAAGYWVGELETNVAITAEYLFFRRLVRKADPAVEQAIVQDLLRTQVDGGWPLFYGGPPDLNCTVEAAVALQMAGLSRDHPALASAEETARGCGGLGRARVFTRIWLALLGALPWDSIPSMPPELMLLPQAFPLNIYRFASWARGTIVPLLVTLNNPPRYDGPPPQVSQFFAGPAGFAPPRPPRFSRKAAFLGLDRLLKHGDGRLRRNPLRARALAAARQWILDHQEPDGGWGGIQPAMVNSVLALYVLDGGSPAVAKGLQAIEDFCLLRDGALRMQSCVSPGWDTPWTLLALGEAGLPPDHPALRRAAGWLLAQQSRIAGDWARKAPGVPAGGWPFEFYNAQYPDTDDTALVLLSLPAAGNPGPQDRRQGLDWLLGMQNRDGGWAAFDRENHTALVEHIPFCDFGEVLDPSSADVTAHALELLGRLGCGRDEPHVRRGLAYLLAGQEPDGAWFGRWGVNYIYGTGAALMALDALGFRPPDPPVARGAEWLRRCQNADGGWGESCLSYTGSGWRGRGPSAASQTAWAVLGLLAAGDRGPALHLGLEWLVSHQNPAGDWDEPYFTGTGFPGDFYIKYHEYRNYFPLLACARARNRLFERDERLSLNAKEEGHG